MWNCFHCNWFSIAECTVQSIGCSFLTPQLILWAQPPCNASRNLAIERFGRLLNWQFVYILVKKCPSTQQVPLQLQPMMYLIAFIYSSGISLGFQCSPLQPVIYSFKMWCLIAILNWTAIQCWIYSIYLFSLVTTQFFLLKPDFTPVFIFVHIIQSIFQ